MGVAPKALEEIIQGESAFINLTVSSILQATVNQLGLDTLEGLTKNIPVPSSKNKTPPSIFYDSSKPVPSQQVIDVTSYVSENGLNGLSKIGRKTLYTNLREVAGDQTHTVLHEAVSLMPDNPLSQILLGWYKISNIGKPIVPGEAFEQAVTRAANKLNKLMVTTPGHYEETSLEFSTRYFDPKDAFADGSIVTLGICMGTIKSIDTRIQNYRIECKASPFTQDEEKEKQKFYESIGIEYDISKRIQTEDGSETYRVEWDLEESVQNSSGLIRNALSAARKIPSIAYQTARAKRVEQGKKPFIWERAGKAINNCIGDALLWIGEKSQYFHGHDKKQIQADRRAGEIWEQTARINEDKLIAQVEAAEARREADIAELQAQHHARQTELVQEITRLRAGDRRHDAISAARDGFQRHYEHWLDGVIDKVHGDIYQASQTKSDPNNAEATLILRALARMWGIRELASPGLTKDKLKSSFTTRISYFEEAHQVSIEQAAARTKTIGARLYASGKVRTNHFQQELEDLFDGIDTIVDHRDSMALRIKRFQDTRLEDEEEIVSDFSLLSAINKGVETALIGYNSSEYEIKVTCDPTILISAPGYRELTSALVRDQVKNCIEKGKGEANYVHIYVEQNPSIPSELESIVSGRKIGLSLTISDNGKGMPTDRTSRMNQYINRIIDEASLSTRKKSEGGGLGSEGWRDYLDNLDTIGYVQSELGNGSSVTTYFPRKNVLIKN